MPSRIWQNSIYPKISLKLQLENEFVNGLQSRNFELICDSRAESMATNARGNASGDF